MWQKIILESQFLLFPQSPEKFCYMHSNSSSGTSALLLHSSRYPSTSSTCACWQEPHPLSAQGSCSPPCREQTLVSFASPFTQYVAAIHITLQLGPASAKQCFWGRCFPAANKSMWDSSNWMVHTPCNHQIQTQEGPEKQFMLLRTASLLTKRTSQPTVPLR